MLKQIRKFNSIVKIVISLLLVSFLSFCLYYSITSNRPVVFCTILTIGILAFLTLFYAFGWFELSHKNLFNQPLFWISIIIPLFLFLSIGFWSWQGHSINFTSDGFNNFLTISKLPLLFLASSVPLTSIVNNIHRTIQTEKQIIEAEKKNISDSYFSHFKYTTELFESLKSQNIKWAASIKSNDLMYPITYDDTILTIKSPIRLYKKIFHHSNAFDGGNYNINIDYIAQIRQYWKNINTQFEKLLSSKAIYEYLERVTESSEAIVEINKHYLAICDLLFITGYNAGKSFNFEEENGKLNFTSTFISEINMYQCLKNLDSITKSVLEIIIVATTSEDFNLERNHFNYKLKSFEEWRPRFTVTGIFDEHQEPLLLVKPMS
ncbi:hypothetical protein [Kosakonia cowanii]|uniref:hypothetical protein n=1 Tax=Kosakonia cowanii TaxID=208223 RepID=UPI003D96A08C